MENYALDYIPLYLLIFFELLFAFFLNVGQFLFVYFFKKCLFKRNDRLALFYYRLCKFINILMRFYPQFFGTSIFYLWLRSSWILNCLFTYLQNKIIPILLNLLALPHYLMQFFLKPPLNNLSKFFIPHLKLLQPPHHFHILRFVLIKLLFLPFPQHALS
jgi:hypothetical protein